MAGLHSLWFERMKSPSLVAAWVSLASLAVAASPKPLPFIEDDYPRAVEEAGRRHLPLVIEVWAPW
jgi:hypothetical protein